MEKARDAGATSAPKAPERTVTVLNSDPYLRTIDFGVDPETSERKDLTIPAAATNKFHKTTPGRKEGVPISVWEMVLKHPTASKLVKSGTLTLLPEI